MDPILATNPVNEGETATAYPKVAEVVAPSLDVRPEPDEGWFDPEPRQTLLIHRLAKVIDDPLESSRNRLGAINAMIRLDEQIRKSRQETGAASTETAGEIAIRLLQESLAPGDDPPSD